MSILHDIALFFHLTEPKQPTIAESLESKVMHAQRQYIEEQGLSEHHLAESQCHSARAEMWRAQAERLNLQIETLEVRE